ncbi:uncharacterized protein LOC105683045 [Athalia rosae]|uniref:uncharacterized protein LOC105683045 n=1 Tax=Athalia rosae TaxID=37344 RepID=UPI000625E472|nr:uncharacterized protein LOC105683045 [Athalia rosae]XP_020706618.1 uncharacterized protein LOC105683045 [Athalia rosae]XP_020706621.1 uncharacterized protein LOC105683045 [Athalia rosae]XP_048506342.1 uncharacterized protein LOC105683045 [Athalia rosae]XP_048506343.1 uncharacterized protein LOC105683045 [Athalia rosae]
MNSAIVNLEQSVREANGKLDMITWQIETFEKECQDPDNEVSVLRLLRSVTQVKEEYQTLRRDILEVQQLQKQLADSLKMQLSQVQGHFNILRDKILGQKPTPQLK